MTRLKAMPVGANGSQCATCDLPPRMVRVEDAALRADRDAAGLLASLRAVDEKAQARFTSLDAAVGELHRMLAELLSLSRNGV